MASNFKFVTQFVTWWRSELIACLPAWLRDLFRRRRTLLVIGLGNENLRLRVCKGDRSRECDPIPFQPANPLAIRQSIAKAMHGTGVRGAEIILELPAQHVLRRTVELPAAAVENLREVLSFEMDRHTPLKAEDAAFDYRIISTDAVTKRVTVEIAVTQRRIAEEAFALAKSLDLTPHRIGIGADDRDARQPLNLIAQSARPDGGANLRRLSMVLAAAACSLGIAAGYLPLHFKRELLAAYEARLDRSRSAALEADTLGQQVTATLERTQFLVERRLSIPTTAALLNELTILLPDDTWLTELRLRGNELSFSGFSPRASSLLVGIEESNMISEVHFASPVTTDPQIGSERFNLSAVVTGWSDE